MALNPAPTVGASPTPAAWQHQALGAQLLSAELSGGRPLLYLSPWAARQPAVPAVPARGGVPVLFPQFAQLGPGRKHGFARQQVWQREPVPSAAAKASEEDADALRYTLAVQPGQCDGWPHAAQLSLETRRVADGLDWQLRLHNCGDSAFEWSGGLHPYWAVQDAWSLELDGLQACAGVDQLQSRALPPQAAPWRWDDAGMECLFDGLPPLTLRTGAHELRLSGTGFTQWMVWNPGRPLAPGLTDLPPGDERFFICIEPVCATRPQRLAPGETFTGTLSVRWAARGA